MKYRWKYFRRMFRGNRPSVRSMFGMLFGIVFLGFLLIQKRGVIISWLEQVAEVGGIEFVRQIFASHSPGYVDSTGILEHLSPEIFTVLNNNDGMGNDGIWNSRDPAYERLLAADWEKRQYEVEEKGSAYLGESVHLEKSVYPERSEQNDSNSSQALSAAVLHEKLADFDFLLQNYYSVHPTTTADKDLLNAETFVNMDLSLEKDGEQPQILIYHTHSQEAYADYTENPEATVVGVGSYLAELLEERGFRVIHDTSQYDVKGGKLDRSQAYTYALDGITGILQKYPAIEVVLDIHRDGVTEETRLVTEVDGKNTAQIMFFNGISQTPDGPIEYLPNPNRATNLAFSFKLQMEAAETYPGLTRKIYLKGLRYNQHVRGRASLIEVGAQTNTYAEALNAMEPLADILCRVLDGT